MQLVRLSDVRGICVCQSRPLQTIIIAALQQQQYVQCHDKQANKYVFCPQEAGCTGATNTQCALDLDVVKCKLFCTVDCQRGSFYTGYMQAAGERIVSYGESVTAYYCPTGSIKDEVQATALPYEQTVCKMNLSAWTTSQGGPAYEFIQTCPIGVDCGFVPSGFNQQYLGTLGTVVDSLGVSGKGRLCGVGATKFECEQVCGRNCTENWAAGMMKISYSKLSQADADPPAPLLDLISKSGLAQAPPYVCMQIPPTPEKKEPIKLVVSIVCGAVGGAIFISLVFVLIVKLRQKKAAKTLEIVDPSKQKDKDVEKDAKADKKEHKHDKHDKHKKHSEHHSKSREEKVL